MRTKTLRADGVRTRLPVPGTSSAPPGSTGANGRPEAHCRSRHPSIGDLHFLAHPGAVAGTTQLALTANTDESENHAHEAANRPPPRPKADPPARGEADHCR